MTANHNPKVEPRASSNTEKDPDDWVSGDDPMTGAQASYLKTLAEQAREPEAFSQRLTKAEASKRIDVLKAKLELFDGPPHPARPKLTRETGSTVRRMRHAQPALPRRRYGVD